MTITEMSNAFSPPVHLDYTTVYGAALAIDDRERAQGRLPLSRLLSLSQLVESIVIHDVLQYELGSTQEWGPYREALDKSTLMRAVTELAIPLVPYEDQIDGTEAAVLAAAEWAIQKAFTIPTAPIEWAVRFRSGTYDGYRTSSMLRIL